MKIASASRRAWHGMQADCCRKPPPVSERGFQEKQTRVKSASKSSSQPAQQYSTQSSYRPRALLQETNRKKSCVIQQDKPQSARGPQQLLGARRYASEATPQQAAAEAHHAGPADLNGQRFVVATSSYTEAGTSQGPLQAEARQLRDLLIDATGRNPAKQRQIAWAAQEGGAEEEEEWLRRLDWAASPASSSRNTFVTVLGDSSEDLAKFSQALLSDPLASDQSSAQALKARVQNARKLNNREQIRTITYGSMSNGPKPSTTGDETLFVSPQIAVTSPYLAQNDLTLQEALFDASAPALSPTLWTTVLTSDIVIVQAEPPASADIYRLLQKKNVIFAFSSSANIRESPRILAPVTPDVASTERQAMQIDVNQALQANDSLQSSARSSISEFSALSHRSGIPQLSEYITQLAASTTTRQWTLRNIFSRAVLDMASNLAVAHQVLYEAEGKIGRLALTTARDRKHSEIELGFTDLDKLDLEQLVSDSPPRSAGSGSSGQIEVIDAKASSTLGKVGASTSEVEEVILLEDGTKGVQAALSHKRLAWWKLPLGRADDVATDLAISLTTYFAGLERKLIFETGRLAERSLDLSLQVNALLKSSEFARPVDKTQLSFYSATMENEISALSPTTQFGFPPPSHPSAYNLAQTSLSAPIESRRVQLKAPGGAIERLQLRAQTCVMHFYTLSGASTAAAIFLNQTSWMQIHQDVPFCVGFAGLGLAAAAWRLQGGWKKSKSKFWTDWKRAQEGLAFDLQSNAEEVLSHKVFVKADVACKVIRKHLNARKAALIDLEQRLRQLQNTLKS